MKKNENLWRLVFNRATLSRVLSEKELHQIGKSGLHRLHINRVSVAGGGQRFRGSESILLDLIDDSVNPIFVDFSLARIPTIIANLKFVWSFKEDFFDLIISTWLVEHLKSPKHFFREAFRVLKPQGIVFCVAPFIARKHRSPYDYFRFTDTALLHLGFSSGFRRMEVRPVGGTPFICCIALLWPFFRLPCLAYFYFCSGGQWIVYCRLLSR